MKKCLSIILSFLMCFTFINVTTIASAESLSDKLTDTSDFALSSIEMTSDKMLKGYNLGNVFENYEMRENYERPDNISDYIAYKTSIQGSVPITEEYIKFLKDSGIQAIRVPVTWFPMLLLDNDDENRMVDKSVWYNQTERENYWYNGKINPKWLAKIKQVVNWVIENDMYCIINVHHDGIHGARNKELPLQFDSEHIEQSKKYLENIWTQIGVYFKDYGSKLLFEGFNEVTDSTNDDGNKITNSSRDAAAVEALKTFITTIRSQGGNNAQRFLVCPRYAGISFWNTRELLDSFAEVDTASDKLILTSHTYPSEGSADNVIQQAKTIMNNLSVGCIYDEIGFSPAFSNNGKFAKDVRTYSDNYKVSCFWWDNGGRSYALTNRYYCHPSDENAFSNFVGKKIDFPTFTQAEITSLDDSSHKYWTKFFTPDANLDGAGKYSIVCSGSPIAELISTKATQSGYYYLHFNNYDTIFSLYTSDDDVTYKRSCTSIESKWSEDINGSYKIYGSTANTVQLDGNYDPILESEISSYTFEAEDLRYTYSGNVVVQNYIDNGCNGDFLVLDGLNGAVPKVGNYCEFTLPSLTAGKYKLTLKTRRFSGRSIFDISVNGETQLESVDFNDAANGYQDIECGEININANGDSTLRFTVSQARTTGFFVDKIVLSKTGDVTEDLSLSLKMVRGASIRLNDVNGIRFYTEINKDKLAELKENGYEVELGTLIAPKDLLGSNELDFSLGNNLYINVPYTASKFYTDSSFSGVVGSIVNIKESTNSNAVSGNIARDFVGRGYAKITKDNKTEIQYADYYNNDIDNNSRSLAYVAYMLKGEPANSDLYLKFKENIDKWASFYVAEKQTFTFTSKNVTSALRIDSSTGSVVTSGVNAKHGIITSGSYVDDEYFVDVSNLVANAVLSTDFAQDASVYICEYDKDKNFITRGTPIVSWAREVYTYTPLALNSETEYIRIHIMVKDNYDAATYNNGYVLNIYANK